MNVILPSNDPKEFFPLKRIPPYFRNFIKASLTEDEYSSSETDGTTAKRSATGKKNSGSKASLVSFDSLQPMNASTSLVTYALSSTNLIQYTNRKDYNFDEATVVPSWRLRERMRTVSVGLILALNIGTDPPDVQKPYPCAKLLCWLDPMSISRAKARERIGERLEAQYARWQQRAKLKYKRALDPTIEDCRSLCIQLRRSAKGERVLLHYNGSGVPKPTPNGELWVFDRQHTQYIPLSTMDLVRWVGKPSIIILDCSGAGILMPFLTGAADSCVSLNKMYEEDRGTTLGLLIHSTPTAINYVNASSTASSIFPAASATSATGAALNKDLATEYTGNLESKEPCAIETEDATTIRDIIVLCPTAANETLPFNAELPADLFTSCLTTPISVALRWHIHQNPLSFSNLDPDCVDNIPGCLNDRKTPLGELNWIFTAVTDTIAWNVLPIAMFQRLFRQDLLVASMFRNFLLADRIFRVLNCTPTSYPVLPSTSDHPLWLSWDLAVETSISKLVRDGILGTIDTRSKSPKLSEDGNEDHQRDNVDDDEDEDDDEDVNDDGNKRGVREESHIGGAHASQILTSSNMILGSTGPVYNVIPPTVSLNAGLTSPYGQDTSFMGTSFHSLHVMSPFFSEQLTAFEVWLNFAATRLQAGGLILSPPLKQSDISMGSKRNLLSLMYPGASIDVEAPEQLPIVLQVLLSQAHRMRALTLLQRFLDLGPSAVNLALCVGIFPYVLKLLQSPMEYKHVLVNIWSRIIDFDPTVRVDLMKDGAVVHFVKHLQWGLERDSIINQGSSDDALTISDQEHDAACQRIMAAKILSAICRGYPQGQMECVRKNLLVVCCKLLKEADIGNEQRKAEYNRFPPEYRLWLCLCIGCLVGNNASARYEASKLDVHTCLLERLSDDCADVRASALHALASLLSSDDITKTHPIVSKVDSLGHLPQHIASSKNSFLLNPSSLLGVFNENKLSSSNPSLYGLGSSTALHSTQNILNLSPFQQQKLTISSTPERIPVHRDVDIEILRAILIGTNDASSVVRFEAVVALAVAVDKHMANFETIASSMLRKGYETEQGLELQTSNDKQYESKLLPSLSADSISIDETQLFDTLLEDGWKRLRSLQRFDPHPVVCAAATSTVSLLYDHVLMKRLQTENTLSHGAQSPVASEHENDGEIPGSSHHHISRVASDLTMYPTSHLVPPLLSRHQSDLHLGNISDNTNVLHQPSNRIYGCGDTFKIKFSFPVSHFFSWKNRHFHQLESSLPTIDPLSREGSIKIYRDERNSILLSQHSYLIDHFSALNPKDVKQISSKEGFEAPLDLLGFHNEDKENEAALAAEVTARKKELYFNQSCLLSSRACDSKRTSVLRFHLCEPILASCDDCNNITIWDVSSEGRRSHNFQNNNPPTSRITSLSWINEMSNSLLLTGCDDGSIRLWGGLLDNCDENPTERPLLAGSFFALPELYPSQRVRGSGLVTEWQQSHGRLIVGGNCQRIRVWDIEAEKCRSIIESDVNACVTSITSTWDNFQLSTQNRADGSSGLGPDIIVSGFSDGTIRAYDLRVTNAGSVLESKLDPRSRLRERWMKQVRFNEHSNWIVNVSFRKTGSRYEIVSGSTAGEIKFWDLRLPTSLRTLDIQRSPMTALASHTSIPLLASGSQAQFIKLMTPDGDVTQVIRYHEKLSNQIIGPVSCLAFHPTQPLLAAGTTDEYIGLYKANIMYR